jgi:hypothetical protein
MGLVYLILLEGLQTSSDCSVGNLGGSSNVGNRDVVIAEVKNNLVHFLVGLGVRVAGGHAVSVEASFGGNLLESTFGM